MAKAIFVQNFTLTANYYGCTPAEVEDMKESARRDMDNAEVCFAALANEAREAGIPLDTTGAIAAEVNRQRTAIAGYACDRTGMVMPARCGDCLCWEADEKRAVNRQRRGR